MSVPALPDPLPVTDENVRAFYDWLFAPWVKELGLYDFAVRPGYAAATLPQNPRLQFVSGATCGQALMSAVDTVCSIAMASGDRLARGTTYQHTHFLRPATGDDMRIEVNVLRFGKTSAFAEAKITFLGSGDLVAHASLEFAF